MLGLECKNPGMYAFLQRKGNELCFSGKGNFLFNIHNLTQKRYKIHAFVPVIQQKSKTYISTSVYESRIC